MSLSSASTQTKTSAKITVLIPGNIHPHVIERLATEFTLLRIRDLNPQVLPPESIRAIRAIAVSPAVDNLYLDADFINAFPNLEIIANFGVGYDGVDAKAAAKSGVIVTNTPDVLTEEVADCAVGLLLSTIREFSSAENWLRSGKWAETGNYRITPLTLRGRKVGILGLGRIGLAVAKRLEAFGLEIHYHNRSPRAECSYPYHDSLKGLAQAVDTLINIAPATPETMNAITAEILAELGENGVFINIGRGNTVDEQALIQALHDGTIKAAGLDVYKNEPNIDPGFLSAPNCVLWPHIGSGSMPTRLEMANLVVNNLHAWFDHRSPLTPVPESAALITPR